MSVSLTPGLRCSPAIYIEKRRDLPVRGRVLVKVGERVTAQSVVAEAEREGELRLVRVAETLGLAPSDALSRIRVKQGDLVKRGDLLAELKGLWGLLRTTVESPIDGQVEFISHATGHIAIRAPVTRLALTAYIDGIVKRVEPERGVVIGTEATFVQGIFGVGGERDGTVRILSIAPDQIVSASDIPEGCAGEILVGGRSPRIEALRCAAERGAVGFVTASIDDATLRDYVGYDIGIALTGDEPVPMTLIITEGFGSIAMNPRVIELLGAVAGARASINGATQVRAGALRPEIIAPPSDTAGGEGRAKEQDQAGLTVGSIVRVIRVPYFGLRAEILELPRELTVIETGAMARVAKARLIESGQVVTVPRANLELA
jgi:hypothetical protein